MDPRPTKTKLHLRPLRLDGQHYTALCLRPDVSARFATRLADDTWHIQTGGDGALLLARCLWAMAYQHQPRTILVIDPGFMVPSPDDGAPSLPIAVVNDELGPLNAQAVTDLGRHLPFRSPSEGTVTVKARSLHEALTQGRAFFNRPEQAAYRDPARNRRWMEGSGGVVVVSAPPPVLREWAVVIHELGVLSTGGSASDYLDYWTEGRGEVQVIEDFGTVAQPG